MGAKAIPNISPDDGKSSTSWTYLVAGQRVMAHRARPGLYLVATPIGNLGDITLRALETLAGADIVFCEDTRITRRLAERYGLGAELAAYHEHNAEAVRPKILQRLSEGAAIALVSDAGTPLISDPGYKLVRAACEAGHAVTALPGPSAVLAALNVAALPTDRFFFEGFLPAKQQARRTRLAELARVEATLVMFEAGSRVQETLADLAGVMAGRQAAICRELTKLHEEVLRGPVHALAAQADELETRGEFVLVIGPPPRDAAVLTQDALDALLKDLLPRSSVKDAVMHAVELSGRPRREVYARALELAKNARSGEADGED
ncbi:16S rRNA (cytidine(1402)-2'-O)-methyltransferase [Bradyrhizobium sp. 83012]|uniref:Ribosomal RNA small subunit methyltransferase I n=1 Tax=Bradyrhizobium aeschynomenes TaxID=2734909 RepID=A0ABX2CK49_9BRAD|nr:16S rRNA (cytidine(1402)-2'-O)-methyltransferase [Bradyrhizobium aeschynomenes]NPU68581.1 16S rRNA (cytidine(1402)-2'-O)-methyltransferase [Bradyrhizobium aeschynomenes]NPV22338.1 16S rRNA (cytidine(1402)-2'-O)-methyltransferase [Bradyrhizobium aeschynomenes]